MPLAWLDADPGAPRRPHPECGLLHKHDTPAMGGNGHPRAEQQYRAPASQRQQQWAE